MTGQKKAILPPDWEQQIRIMIGFILSNEQAHCRRSPAIRQQHCCCRSCIVIQVGEYLLNNCLLLVKTRFNRFAQVIEALFSAGVWSDSFGDLVFMHLPRLDGVTRARYLLLGAKTPWKRVRLTLGLGTKATSLEIKSSGSNITWVVPLRQ